MKSEKEIRETFRARLIELKGGRTNKQLAAECKMSACSVKDYVSGCRMPDVERLAILAQHFGVSTDWLLGLTDARKDSNRSKYSWR